jgi:hypothetical protein
MISENIRAKMASVAKPNPVVIREWTEVNKNGTLIPTFAVKCHACGGVVETTRSKTTIYHTWCQINRIRQKNPRRNKEKIAKMTPREKDKKLLALMEMVEEYQHRYGLLVGKDHIIASDPLIQAMNNTAIYERINRIAKIWTDQQ